MVNIRPDIINRENASSHKLTPGRIYSGQVKSVDASGKVSVFIGELSCSYGDVVPLNTSPNTKYTVGDIVKCLFTDEFFKDIVILGSARIGADRYPTIDQYDEIVSDIDEIMNLIGQGDAAVPNVLYVAKNGSDDNDGTTLGEAKLTIKAALALATPDTTVYVKSGDYTEANPVTIPAKVSLVGDSARSTTVRPQFPSQDLFYINNASYVTGFTFKDHVSPAAAIAFNPDGSAGAITQSPYVFDCSSITTTGTGMRVDGAAVSGGKSMLAGQYTQLNLGGKGIHLLNRGYAQLIAIYTICCDVSVVCESGAFCSLIGSDTSFGNYGLRATGVSEVLYTGTSSGAPVNSNSITITGLPHTPYVNNVVSFDDGSTYYAIDSVTPISGGSSTISLDQRLSSTISSGITAKFYQASKIMASNHTFEYCGSGIDLINSRPQFGGTPIQENEIIEELGGQVYFTSTDQKGDFRIGSELKIDRGSGTIEGVAFDRSLFAVLTPYILAIEG